MYYYMYSTSMSLCIKCVFIQVHTDLSVSRVMSVYCPSVVTTRNCNTTLDSVKNNNNSFISANVKIIISVIWRIRTVIVLVAVFSSVAMACGNFTLWLIFLCSSWQNKFHLVIPGSANQSVLLRQITLTVFLMLILTTIIDHRSLKLSKSLPVSTAVIKSWLHSMMSLIYLDLNLRCWNVIIVKEKRRKSFLF